MSKERANSLAGKAERVTEGLQGWGEFMEAIQNLERAAGGGGLGQTSGRAPGGSDPGADLPYQSYAGVKPGTTPWVGGSAYDRYGNRVDPIDEAHMAAYDANYNPINGFRG